MNTNKYFFLQSVALVSIIDFIKWTSTFGEGMITQIETPLSGVRLSPGLSHLFAFGRDDIGWMLVMDEKEGAWLESFPIASILIGASDGITIISDSYTMLEQEIEGIGIDIFIPQIDLREQLERETLMGFGLKRVKTGLIERVNKIAPIMTVKKYGQLAKSIKARTNTSLFSA